MSHEKTTLEVIAPTVEEAVESGLNQLGLPRDAVDVEVLDSGSRGLFGLGGRQARVRLTIQLMDAPVSNHEPAKQSVPAPAVVPAPINEAAVPAALDVQKRSRLKWLHRWCAICWNG
jgi:spoIIIJ-associated protein